jgi:hypothetical protein
MWFPDDVQHLQALSSLAGRWAAPSLRARSLTPVAATAHRSVTGPGGRYAAEDRQDTPRAGRGRHLRRPAPTGAVTGR